MDSTTTSSAAPKRIGIAIVEFESHYLVGVRGPDGPLPGYSEFPGGKCNDGETPEDCAVRECFEESGLRVTASRQFEQKTFTYPHGTVELYFVECRLIDNVKIGSDHNGFRWVPRKGLKQLNFPEANQSIIELINASP